MALDEWIVEKVQETEEKETVDKLCTVSATTEMTNGEKQGGEWCSSAYPLQRAGLEHGAATTRLGGLRWWCGTPVKAPSPPPDPLAQC